MQQQSVVTPPGPQERVTTGRLVTIYELNRQLKERRAQVKQLEAQIKLEMDLARSENLTQQGNYRLISEFSDTILINKDQLFLNYPEKFVQIAKIEIGRSKEILTPEEFASVASTERKTRLKVIHEREHS